MTTIRTTGLAGGSDWTECTEFNEKLRQGRYDIVRNTDRFKAVENEITPYVVTKN